ncbi:MAG: CPBP family intramembrane metalloprotease [Candidatus Moranbacteria bacterium]|nr:CPBP family intramembrane metalloprotease [Candidatus Moranbacteria bacterium]
MERWLRKEATIREAFVLAVAMIVVKIGYSYVLGIAFPQLKDAVDNAPKLGMTILAFSTPFLFLFYALMEEVIFRAPLSIAEDLGWSVRGMMVASLVLSVVFGLLHGSPANIPYQGVAGFFYCIMYLKCGGLTGNGMKAIAVTSISHFTWNMLCIANLYCHGVRVV